MERETSSSITATTTPESAQMTYATRRGRQVESFREDTEARRHGRQAGRKAGAIDDAHTRSARRGGKIGQDGGGRKKDGRKEGYISRQQGADEKEGGKKGGEIG